MPSTNVITLKDGKSKIRVWNIDQRVGGSDSAFSVEAELVQFLLAVVGTKLSDRAIIGFEQVNGVWDANSQAALEAYEQFAGSTVVSDHVVDPMKAGHAFGSVSHRVYKIMILQNEYVKIRFGTDPHRFKPHDLEVKLMSIPEDNMATLPPDLSFFMKASRPSGFLRPT